MAPDNGVFHNDGVFDNGALGYMHPRRDDGMLDTAIDDTPAGNQAAGDEGVVAELYRGPLALPGVYRPVFVAEIGWLYREDLHIGLPVTFYRTDIPPVPFESVRENAAIIDHPGEDIPAEVMAYFRL